MQALPEKMTMKWHISMALYGLANIIGFFALKDYNDMRQVRTVRTCSKSTVELAAIGNIIERKPYVKFKGKEVVEVGYKYKKTGFGQVNSGTGVFVSNDGLILTCYHVTRHSKLVQVSLNGFESDYDMEEDTGRPVRKLFAYVIGFDEDNDLALLRVIYPGQWFRAARLRKEAETGLPVFTIGFPQGLEKYVTHGVISNHFEDWTYSDTVMDHGSSGGGLFDCNGDLVGLADKMVYPNGLATYQGYDVFTNLDAMHKLIEKYKDF